MTAKQLTTICCYCSVGCGLICSVDKNTGKIFNIEGDPDHPINEGSLCAKGAGIFDLTEANEHRLRKVLYRAPKSDKWEEKDWDWALNRIARLVKDTRDKGFAQTTPRARWSTGGDHRPSRQLQRRQRGMLADQRCVPVDGARLHRPPGPGLTQSLCSGSGRVVRARFDDEPLHRSEEQRLYPDHGEQRR